MEAVKVKKPRKKKFDVKITKTGRTGKTSDHSSSATPYWNPERGVYQSYEFKKVQNSKGNWVYKKSKEVKDEGEGEHEHHYFTGTDYVSNGHLYLSLQTPNPVKLEGGQKLTFHSDENGTSRQKKKKFYDNWKGPKTLRS